MTRTRATALGFGAVLLWSLLALFTVATVPVPPFLLNALTLSIGGLAGLIWLAVTGGWGRLATVPATSWALVIGGLFGYHALYYTALRHAPAAEAGLIAYLWPLLIVLFSGLLPGEKLSRLHILGAVVSFAGVAVLFTGGEAFGGLRLGHIVAIGCALTWSGYSVLSRLAASTPTAAIAPACLIAGLLSGVLHLMLETPAWPTGTLGWAAIFGLGLGPTGLAFFIWDIGVKHGDIQLLGTASYAAPLLSTLILVATGAAAARPELLAAAVLITGGAALAALPGRVKAGQTAARSRP